MALHYPRLERELEVRQQPSYRLLADFKDTLYQIGPIYAPEDELTALTPVELKSAGSKLYPHEPIIHHSTISEFFDYFDGTKFSPRPWLRLANDFDSPTKQYIPECFIFPDAQFCLYEIANQQVPFTCLLIGLKLEVIELAYDFRDKSSTVHCGDLKFILERIEKPELEHTKWLLASTATSY
ncbi:unnamed protein product [Hymenolepis diminuta]|uniref:Uncharacterized protein n=1 Tax=Hymenolepis diminuta TaxID=6216 RepID=A0A564YRT4_HYMDI|nr:unnamed protein product [Hymenolepis diminuta]